MDANLTQVFLSLPALHIVPVKARPHFLPLAPKALAHDDVPSEPLGVLLPTFLATPRQ